MDGRALAVDGLLILYGAAFLFWILGAVARKEIFIRLSVWWTVAAFVMNTVIIAHRWIAAERAPFKTLYETMVFYPWCVTPVVLILLAMYRLRILIPFASALCGAGLIYALARPDIEIVNLPPALQSGWFVPHVVIYFIAYAALFASCVLAFLFLARPQWRSEESRAGFEDYAHRAVMFGFSALTIGLIFGAVWGKAAWGDYWSWDPKENWALVTWLAYLLYLHIRLIHGWKGRRAMALCIAAFAAVVFTYLGMNLLPSASDSLHVYQ